MPADASLPPQPLSAHAVGEVALDYDRSKPGSDRIAWGEMEPKHRMLMGRVINDGKRAYLTDRTLLLAAPESDPASKVTFIETYDFIDEGKSILFFTVEKGRPFNGMYKLDIATGKTSPMPTDAQHNETHSFPNVHYGLEETNRASDPSSPYRGVSGHRPHLLSFLLKQQGVADAEAVAQKYGGKIFDLYVLDWQTGKRRQLTNVSRGGAEAHQSTLARDGQHIAFSLQGRSSREYAGKDGLYIGTFAPGK